MAERDDEESVGVVVGALAGIALVALGVVFAKNALNGSPVGASRPPLSAASTMDGVAAHDADRATDGIQLAPPGPAVVEVDILPVGDAMARLYFEVGSSDLPPDAGLQLAEVVVALEAHPAAIVLISGFHDETGSAAANAAVSRDRALAVHAALRARGIPEDRLKLRKPESTLGDGRPDAARRVEIRVQPG